MVSAVVVVNSEKVVVSGTCLGWVVSSVVSGGAWWWVVSSGKCSGRGEQ